MYTVQYFDTNYTNKEPMYSVLNKVSCAILHLCNTPSLFFMTAYVIIICNVNLYVLTLLLPLTAPAAVDFCYVTSLIIIQIPSTTVGIILWGALVDSRSPSFNLKP